jgi:hypothetical protein
MKTSPHVIQERLMIGYGSDENESPNKTISEVGFSN